MVARVSKEKTIGSSLHLSVLPKATQRALHLCQNFLFLKEDGWYLAGGTALALQAGHRESVDLDFFHPSKARVRIDSVAMLITADIAVMKIIAISQRGRKRDFIDLYWLCHNGESLREILPRVVKQYPQDHNTTHILKSLVYFDDAEADPMPTLFFRATWTAVKAFFRREVPQVARQLLKLS